MCRNAGMMPVDRGRIEGRSVYIADGFSAPPHHKFRRFGLEPHEFPFGAFITLWWIEKGEGELDVGAPMIFDAFHNPEYSKETKQIARINTAMNHARDFIIKFKKAH